MLKATIYVSGYCFEDINYIFVLLDMQLLHNVSIMTSAVALVSKLINISTQLEMTSDALQNRGKVCYVKHCKCA